MDEGDQVLCNILLEILVVSRNLTLKVLVATIDAQWEGIGDVGLARYEPALRPPCPTIRVLVTITSKFSEIQHFKS